MNPWLLYWESPYESHDYEPAYLGNGTFGGMVGLAGADADWWSSQVAGMTTGGKPGLLYPVTAFRTQVVFRIPNWSESGIVAGRGGIYCQDPRYTSDPSMPHRPQVYGCRQSLDLRSGVLTTEGTGYLGSEAAWRGGLEPERGVHFRIRVAALKDSGWLGVEIEADAEIGFVPGFIAEERLGLHAKARGVHRLGNEIDCDLQLRQSQTDSRHEAGCIAWTALPEGGTPYRITARGGDAVWSVGAEKALAGSKRCFFTVQLEPGIGELSASGEVPSWAIDAEAFFAEQAQRWATFWAASEVTLPVGEALWQQRYHASLFNVAQSVGDGPTHPGGLSRPMLPYWVGCFHDTDTYYCRALLESGRGDQAARHLRYRHRGLAIARELAKDAGRSGALYPWQTDAVGRGEAHDVPVNGAILAVEAWHHFCYARQPEAREAAREILAQTLRNLRDHLETTATPLRLKDYAIMTFSETMTGKDPTEARVAFRAVATAWLAAGGGDDDLDSIAQRIIDELTLPVNTDGSYRLTAEGDAEPAYLRCPSVTLGSFPLHTLPADETLARTFSKELARILYLFAWLPHQASVVASQLGRREGPTSASHLLRAADSFYKPWHAYDEWENRRTVRAANFVTAAGGFVTALHHLLLAETAPGVWSLFPGAPDDWSDLAFRRLITRAGWSVSAVRKAGKVIKVEAAPVGSEADATFVLQWNDRENGHQQRQWSKLNQ